MRGNTHSRLGSVLLVALTVLTVLSLMGFVFVSLARTERDVSHSFVDGTRATMLAEGGLERALMELSSSAPIAWSETTAPFAYFGEDLNANGVLDAGEDTNGNGRLDTVSCELKNALRPSYPALAGGTPQLRAVDGNLRGYSGMLSGTYGQSGDRYSLKIIECAARIHVNGSNASLERVLNNLGIITGAGAAVGTAIVRGRPAAGYFVIGELKPVLGQRAYDIISPYLTVNAWVDTKVVKPRALDRRLGRRNRTPLRVGDSIYGYDEINCEALELEPRAPVDINTAPSEVLQALLRGLAGWFIREIPFNPVNGCMGLGYNYEWMGVRSSYEVNNYERIGVIAGTTPITDQQALQMAVNIVRARMATPFKSWDQFNRFIDSQVASGVVAPEQGDVLKANFNPNTDLNDFNPDAAIYKAVDKSDLLVDGYSTEFCFGSMGYYTIFSLGWVVDTGGRVMGEKEIRVDTKLCEVCRHTSESDFMQDFVQGGNLLNASGQPGGGAFSQNRGNVDTGSNVSLGAYPEPILPFQNQGPSRAWVRDAKYDGYLALATLQARRTGDVCFRASLHDSGFAADEAIGARANVPDDSRTGTNVVGPVLDKLMPGRSTGAGHPGDMRPDGAYVERDSALMYRATSCIDVQRQQTRNGTISFWVKPNWDPVRTGKIHVMQSLQRISTGTPTWYPNGIPFGVFCFPATRGNTNPVYGDGPYNYGLVEGYGTIGYGLGFKQAFPDSEWVMVGQLTNPPDFQRLRPHRWTHIAVQWNFDTANFQEGAKLFINGRQPPTSNTFNYGAGAVWPLQGRINYAFHSTGIENSLKCGGWSGERANNHVADATLDEIVVLRGSGYNEEDFAHRQWENGRYYKENDATYFSPEVDVSTLLGLPQGSAGEVGVMAWTQYIPRDLPQCAVELYVHDGNQWHGPFTDASSSLVVDSNRNPVSASRIRYRLVIRPNVGINGSVVESPVIDDVTFMIPLRPPALLSYSILN